MASTSHSSRKHATKRDSASTTCQTPRSPGGTMRAAPNGLNTMPAAPNVMNTMPATPNVLNTMSAAPNVLNTMPSKTQCTVTLATAPNSSCMKFGQLSEELVKWGKELQGTERDFVEMVAQLNVVDRMVFQNISRLECLHKSLIQLSESQADVSSDLNRINSQLLMAEEAVRILENVAEAKQSCQATRASASCTNENLRINLYNFMVQLNSDLNYSTERLSDVIQASNHPRNAGDGISPVMQIGCILNYHYECLVDIEDVYLKCKTALDSIQKNHNQMMATSSNSKC